MTFYELYRDHREEFMRAIEEQVNWTRVARLLDKDHSTPSRGIGLGNVTFEKDVFAELRITLLDAIDEVEAEQEANTDKEPASQAADDVIAQSRRQDGKA